MSEQFIKSQMRGVVGGKNNNNKTAIMVFPGPIWGLQGCRQNKKAGKPGILGIRLYPSPGKPWAVQPRVSPQKSNYFLGHPFFLVYFVGFFFPSFQSYQPEGAAHTKQINK